MTWELLYKVGEEIIFQIFILIYAEKNVPNKTTIRKNDKKDLE